MSNAHAHPAFAAALALICKPETRMTAVTTKTKAWLPPKAPKMTAAELTLHGNIESLFYTEADMGRHGWQFVGTATITIELPEVAA